MSVGKGQRKQKVDDILNICRTKLRKIVIMPVRLSLLSKQTHNEKRIFLSHPVL